MPKVRPENGMQRNNPLKADKFTAFLTNFLDNCLKIRQFKKLLGKVPCKRDLFSASLALPINITAGLFGMNVGGIPLAANESGFWLIVGVVALFTVAGVWLLLRERHEA